MPIISPTAISPHNRRGISWQAYWTNQFKPAIRQQYYWYDHATYGSPGRRIRILHDIDGVKGIDYVIVANSDSSYEIGDIFLVDLECRKNGEINPTSYTSLYGLGQRMDTLTFTGKKITHKVSTNSGGGIYKAVLLPGSKTFRGGAHTSSTTKINDDKAEGYFYLIQQAGNYSALDASLSSLLLYDIILYSGGAWSKLSSTEYLSIDIDTYSATPGTLTVTLFEGLPLATYTVGLAALGTKNPASLGTTIYPSSATTILARPFTITGGVPNCGNNGISIIGTVGTNSHMQMSTTIKKNGTAQTAGWIPEHSSSSGTQLNYHAGEDMQNWVDGIELTGNNTGDLEAIPCNSYVLKNISYAVNAANGTEELLKVTTEFVFTINGINIKNEYEGLVDTYMETMFSYMLSWTQAVWNKFVDSNRRETTLPDTNVRVDLPGMANATGVLVYNSTVGGNYENYLMSINVPDPIMTNPDQTLMSYLYNIETIYGKFYMKAGYQRVLSVGEKWNTETILRVGRVSDLIAKIAKYVE